MRLRAQLILFTAVGLACPSALVGGTGFLPTPSDNGAYVEVFSSHEQDEQPSSVQQLEWSDTFIREKLTLYSNGYFYHPRFLQYRLLLSGALKQEDYSASYLPSSGWRHGSGYEYEARTIFLPEHPYNLELYALRYEPLFKEQAATQRDSIQTSWGGLFRYRKKPWFFSSRYNENTTRTGVVSSTVRRFGVDGEYYRRYESGNQFSLNAAYNPSRFTHSSGLEGDSTSYSIGNLVDLQRASLNSTLTGNQLDQLGGALERYESDQISWYELLNVYLPLNFRSDLSYQIQNNESKIPDPLSSRSSTLTDISRTYKFDLYHRLYESLDTAYTYWDSTREFSDGETASTSNSLALNYNKTVPRGRAMIGLSLARSRTENQGRADILNEAHPATAVPGSFVLGQQNVEPGSIAVYVRSRPPAPFETIRLEENVHYTLTPVLNTFEVNVNSLPPQFLPPGSFDFTVSYSLTTGDFGLLTDSIGYNASVELLDTLLTPYYNFVAVRSDVLSGDFPGVPLDTTTYTAGLRFLRGPLRALAEYQNLEWEISPYRSWRAEVQYVGSLNSTTRVYATASYLDRLYPRGSSFMNRDAFSDETASASGNIQKQVPSQGLTFSAGGAYSQFLGRVAGNSYSLNASMTWKVGKMDLSAGGSAYASAMQGLGGSPTSRHHQYYYVNLRRTFF